MNWNGRLMSYVRKEVAKIKFTTIGLINSYRILKNLPKLSNSIGTEIFVFKKLVLDGLSIAFRFSIIIHGSRDNIIDFYRQCMLVSEEIYPGLEVNWDEERKTYI
jgi:hypothetical protein